MFSYAKSMGFPRGLVFFAEGTPIEPKRSFNVVSAPGVWTGLSLSPKAGKRVVTCQIGHAVKDGHFLAIERIWSLVVNRTCFRR